MKDVCVIGAGSSGIASCQVLQARGVPFDCYETGSGVGGNWRFQNDNGMSSAYRSLHINTSRQLMAYKTFPMPADYPAYPSHALITRYFDAYVDHFGFRSRIQFRTPVVRVEPVAERGRRDGSAGWHVTVKKGEREETHRYGAVLVANGHHWDPRWPEPAFPGEFAGETIHSHFYKSPEVLKGKRVLVLGIGNSASDIAVESSKNAERTVLAMRRGAHLFPKFLFGGPTDRLVTPFLTTLPLPVQRGVVSLMLRIAQGKVTDYGLPKPDHALLDAHPTISDDLLPRLGHGDIVVKPNILRFEGEEVVFVDGTREPIDLIVYCTGYKISFPFLDRAVFHAEENRVPLYLRVIDPEHPGLYFVGLVQPLGAIMPLAEAQSEWIADLLTGRATLPGVPEMKRQIEEYDQKLRRRYVASKRHTIQVDFHPYLAELRKEGAAGRKRRGVSRALGGAR